MTTEVVRVALKPSYSSSWAIVIGINRYDHDDYRDLKCAVNDAHAFAELLVTELEFPADQVLAVLDPPPPTRGRYTLLGSDATKAALEPALFDTTASARADDRLVVFFAGHGESHPAPFGGTPVGYLLPSDARPDAISSKIVMRRLTSELSEVFPGKHALFLLDCCYSGLARSRDGEGRDGVAGDAPAQALCWRVRSSRVGRPALSSTALGRRG